MFLKPDDLFLLHLRENINFRPFTLINTTIGVSSEETCSNTNSWYSTRIIKICKYLSSQTKSRFIW